MNKKFLYFITIILLSGCSYFNKNKEYNILKDINDLNSYIQKNNLFIFDTESTSLSYFLADKENNQVPLKLDPLIKLISDKLLQKNQNNLLDLIYSQKITPDKKDLVLKHFNKFIKTKVEDHFFNPKGIIFKNINFKSIKPEVIEFIKKIQNSEAKAMILTARPWDIREITEKQIGAIKINMGINPIYNKEMVNKDGDIKTQFGYRNGIVYLIKYPGTDEKTNKGTVLLSFLEKINYKPEKVIYIDSSLDNLLDVKNSLKEKNIEVIPFWNKGYIEDKTLDLETLKFIEKALGPDWDKINLNLKEAASCITEKIK